MAIGNQSRSYTYEDRYYKIRLYGTTEIGPAALPQHNATQPTHYMRCNVDAAERQLDRRLNSFNAQKHNMCKDGFDVSGYDRLAINGEIQETMWATMKAESGKHLPLAIYARHRYPAN